MTTSSLLKAPFPWYGGKSRAAPLIWQLLGDVPNFIDPFFGSGAVLFGRPHPPHLETINDADGFVANVMRALRADPAPVAQWCDRQPNECDLHAVHSWLVNQRETFTARLMGDPDYYDAQVAGRWLYGVACWIGGGWCSGNGPWQSVEGQLLHLGNTGQGVHRQRLHLGNTGQGVHRKHGDLLAWFTALQARLRHVRVCCGDWTRVLGPSVTTIHGLTGILLDPPYQEDEREELYAVETRGVADETRHWALAHGDNPLLRIVLCGYETSGYSMPDSWEKIPWSTNGGYGNQGQGRGRTNKTREVLWGSPACVSLTNQPGTQQLLAF